MSEHWRAIPGWAGRYDVSDRGNVRSWVTRHPGLTRSRPVLMNLVYRKQNVRIGLWRNNQCDQRIVSRLVLEAFLGPCPHGKECAHADGDPWNNHIGNLRWATPRENQADKIRHGRSGKGEKNPAAKLNAKTVRDLRRLKNPHFTNLGKRHAVSRTAISEAVAGKTWRHLQ